VSLSATTASLTSGSTKQLTATIAPTNATNQTVSWSSSNTAVAAVSTSGLVTAVAAGTATITVKTTDGSKTATCVFTVTSPIVSVTSVSLSATTASLTSGSTKQLTATIAPTNATNQTVSWSSSNTAVATVSTSGLVTAVATGTATITVKTTDGSKTATCVFTVTAASTVFSLQIEAENYSSMFGVQKETTTDTGGGLNVGYIDSKDWMAYNNITIPNASSFTVSYRVASLSGGGKLQLETNAGQTILDPAFAIPNTGGWQNWQTVTRTVSLPAGTYSLGLKAVTGGFNINWFSISSSTLKSITIISAISETGDPTFTIFPNPCDDKLTLLKQDNEIGTLLILDMTGKTIRREQMKNGVNDIDVAMLKSGIYIARYQNGNNSNACKFMKR
jgi:hypothetical protein